MGIRKGINNLIAFEYFLTPADIRKKPPEKKSAGYFHYFLEKKF